MHTYVFLEELTHIKQALKECENKMKQNKIKQNYNNNI